MNKLFLTATGCILVSASQAGMRIDRPIRYAGSAYTLKAIYHTGELHTYAVETAIFGLTGDQKPVGIRFDMRMHVIKVQSNRATIRVASGAPTSGNKAALPSEFKTATVQLDQWNNPVNSGDGGQIFTRFPNHSIKVGEAWKGVSNLNLGSNKGALVDTEYTLTGVKTFKGRQIAELRLKLGGLAAGEGTELVDLADGSLLASDINLQVNGGKQVNNGQKVPVQIVLKRLT